MKLFHKKNGKEIAYVQMEDIMNLKKSDIPIPKSIYRKVVKDSMFDDISNRADFVKFDEESEVKFFKELEFIINFDYYKNFTEEQLEKEYEEIAKKVNDIVIKLDNMTEEQRNNNRFALMQEYENLRYILLVLKGIYIVKQGKREMPFSYFVKVPQKLQKKSFLNHFKKKKNVK